MTVAERIRVSKLLKTMGQHKEMAESVGLKNASEFINIDQQKNKGGDVNALRNC